MRVLVDFPACIGLGASGTSVGEDGQSAGYPATMATVAVSIAAMAVAGVAFLAERSPAAADHADPCTAAVDHHTHRLLVDLSKPAAPMASAALRSVSMDLAAGDKLDVYAVTGDPQAPRRFVGGLCKPYSNEDLRVAAAKDGRSEARDCADLPAQIPRPHPYGGAESLRTTGSARGAGWTRWRPNRPPSSPTHR